MDWAITTAFLIYFLILFRIIKLRGGAINMLMYAAAAIVLIGVIGFFSSPQGSWDCIETRYYSTC